MPYKYTNSTGLTSKDYFIKPNYDGKTPEYVFQYHLLRLIGKDVTNVDELQKSFINGTMLEDYEPIAIDPPIEEYNNKDEQWYREHPTDFPITYYSDDTEHLGLSYMMFWEYNDTKHIEYASPTAYNNYKRICSIPADRRTELEQRAYKYYRYVIFYTNQIRIYEMSISRMQQEYREIQPYNIIYFSRKTETREEWPSPHYKGNRLLPKDDPDNFYSDPTPGVMFITPHEHMTLQLFLEQQMQNITDLKNITDTKIEMYTNAHDIEKDVVKLKEDVTEDHNSLSEIVATLTPSKVLFFAVLASMLSGATQSIVEKSISEFATFFTIVLVIFFSIALYMIRPYGLYSKVKKLWTFIKGK